MISERPRRRRGRHPGDDRRDFTTAQPVTLTGVQPTEDLHLGNYIGAIRPLAHLAVDPTREVYVFVADRLQVNSFHHQGIDVVGTGLRVGATAPDGTVESVWDPAARWCRGVQWHPEVLTRPEPVSLPTVRPAARLASAAASIAGLAAGAVAWRALWQEPRHGRVRERELALPRWPAALTGLRIALISDLHAGAPHVDEQRLERMVAAVNARTPDLVVLLGDFIDPKVRLGSQVAPEDIAGALGALRAPLGVVAVLGNHDWLHGGERIADALRAVGIPTLENDSREVGALWVAGVADARMRRADIGRALAHVPADAPVVLLSHDPDVFPHVPARVALTVSGHTHGGQVAVPRLRRRFIPSRHGERYARGHIVEDGRHLYVTSGVGTSGWPVRLFAPPEVVVLRLAALATFPADE